MRASDDPAALLMRALGVQPAADAAAAAARYGGAELRAAEEQREQQRQARIAELRQRFVDGPVFVMPCGGSGTSNSLGAVVIPGAGTVYFHPYRLSGPCGTLAAENGVLVGVRWRLAASAGARARRRRDDLRRRMDVQGRGGMGCSRRRTAGRLRSRPAAAVSRAQRMLWQRSLRRLRKEMFRHHSVCVSRIAFHRTSLRGCRITVYRLNLPARIACRICVRHRARSVGKEFQSGRAAVQVEMSVVRPSAKGPDFGDPIVLLVARPTL